MNEYKYIAVDAAGNKIYGTYSGKNKKELLYEIKERKLYLISCKKRLLSKFGMYKFGKANCKEIFILCRQFSTTISSGIHLTEALRILSFQQFENRIRKSLIFMKEEVEKGKALSAAMREFEFLYPSFMLDMIEIGEESGTLEARFNDLANFYEKENKIINKIKKSITYPIFVFALFIGIFSIVISKLLPIFLNTIIELGGKPSFIILFIVKFPIVKCTIFLFILVFCIFYIKRRRRGDHEFIKRKDEFIWNFPVVKNVYRKFLFIRFVNYLSILFSAGIPIIKAMVFIKDKMGSTFVEGKFSLIIQYIEEGATFSEAIKKINLFPPIIVSMISIGEETGQMEKMLRKLEGMLREEWSYKIEQSLTLIEPILILFLAVNIGFMLLILLQPVFQIMDSI